MNEETKEIVQVENGMSVLPDPEERVQFGRKAAKALMNAVESKQNKLVFNGKTYVDVADWEMVGHFFNVSAKTEWTKRLESAGGMLEAYEARVVLVSTITGIEIGGGEALCSRDEKNWKSKPDFQLKSMAQTRATGKALRNVFAWVVVLAGYEATPSEEMRDVAREEKLPPCPICHIEALMDSGGKWECKYYCKKGAGGCGAKFKTLDEVTTPEGKRIADFVGSISRAEIKFKKAKHPGKHTKQPTQ